MPARSSVEPKREFIKIVFQMLVAYGPLVRAQHPPFQQRSRHVAMGQKVLSEFLCGADNLMAVPHCFQWPITGPSIRLEDRTRFN